MSSSATDCPHSFAYNSREKKNKRKLLTVLNRCTLCAEGWTRCRPYVKNEKMPGKSISFKNNSAFLKDNNNSYVSFSSAQNASKFRAALLGAWPF